MIFGFGSKLSSRLRLVKVWQAVEYSITCEVCPQMFFIPWKRSLNELISFGRSILETFRVRIMLSYIDRNSDRFTAFLSFETRFVRFIERSCKQILTVNDIFGLIPLQPSFRVSFMASLNFPIDVVSYYFR